MDRRRFLKISSAGVAEAAVLWAWDAANNPVGAKVGLAAPGPISYGTLDGRAPDSNGIVLPEGFRSRLIATGGEKVPGTGYTWHAFSDGAACFPIPQGGWYYASNSEVDGGAGGASAIRFDATGKPIDAVRILDKTSVNCAGGATPWNTWLSCEEVGSGFVWECDPSGRNPARKVPALGEFRHEAVAVDASERVLYLTEDEPDGLFYRFVPAQFPSLERGQLEALRINDDKSIQWLPVPKPTAWGDTPTRKQVAAATVFDGGEGVAVADGAVYFTTKGDNVVHRLDTRARRHVVLYDLAAPLSGVDQVIVDPVTSNLFVAEDAGNMEIVVIDARGKVAPFVRVVGHDDSEISGLAFAPDMSRLYFSSQRGPTAKKLKDLFPQFDDARPLGAVYEVVGPFLATATTGARVIDSAGSDVGSAPSKLPYVVGGAIGAAAVAVGGAVAFRQRVRS